MFDKAEILARLQNGDSMDEIAKEMTDTLNEANAQYQEETIKANAEKLEAERVEAAKSAAIDTVIGGLVDYCVASGMEDLAQELQSENEASRKSLMEGIDSILAMLKLIGKLENLEFGPVATKREQVKKSVNADEAIRNFLASI